MSPDEIDRRFVFAKQNVLRKRKLEAKLGELLRIQDEASEKLAELKKQMLKERDDVQQLEGLGLTGLLALVSGTKEEKLQKERKEYAAAQLKFDEATLTVQQASDEVNACQSELTTFEDAEGELAKIATVKEEWLVESGDERANKLLQYSEEVADLRAMRREIEEAIEVGIVARRSLEDAKDELVSARNWGTWDLAGGGMFVTAMKHQRMDNAQRLVSNAQGHLGRFQAELADTSERLNLSLQLDSFTRFADLFFDGILMDWMVQSNIRNSLDACINALKMTESALDECYSQLSKLKDELKDIDDARLKLIDHA